MLRAVSVQHWHELFSACWRFGRWCSMNRGHKASHHKTWPQPFVPRRLVRTTNGPWTEESRSITQQPHYLDVGGVLLHSSLAIGLTGSHHNLPPVVFSRARALNVLHSTSSCIPYSHFHQGSVAGHISTLRKVRVPFYNSLVIRCFLANLTTSP